MSATIQYPTLNVLNFTVNPVYLKGDDASVNQYCTEKNYSLVSYEVEAQRFSNQGGILYQYYADGEWKTEFGFSKIVTLLIYDEIV